MPGAGGCHILSCSIAGLINEADVNLISDQKGVHLCQLRVTGYLVDLGLQLIDDFANGIGEQHRFLHVGEDKERNSNHLLA